MILRKKRNYFRKICSLIVYSELDSCLSVSCKKIQNRLSCCKDIARRQVFEKTYFQGPQTILVKGQTNNADVMLRTDQRITAV